MKVVGKHMFVKFEMNDSFQIGDLKLEKPVGVYDVDKDGDRRFITDGNINRLEVNPQIATIVVPSEKYRLSKDDKVLLHYMAWEWCREEATMEVDGEDCHLTESDYILGVIRGDQYEPVDNTYFGKRVFLEAPKTESGIFLTPYDKIKEASHIEITHLPKNTKQGYEHLTVGHIAITIDDKQYPFTIGEEEYIKLTADEIVAWADKSIFKELVLCQD